MQGPREQRLFRWLSTFAGGCTLEAATEVAAALGMDRADVLPGLAALAESSLLRRGDRPDESRFEQLETLREFGLRELAAAGETVAAGNAHAAYFLALAEAAEPELDGPAQADWLRRLEREHDNFRTALAWYRDQPGAGLNLVRLCWTLSTLWDLHGHLTEGRAWLEAAIERADLAPPLVQSRALGAAGELAMRQGDCALAGALLERSLDQARHSDDPCQMLSALNAMASLMCDLSDYDCATAYWEEAIEIAIALRDTAAEGTIYQNLGTMAFQRGDYARTVALTERCIAIFRRAGSSTLLAHGLYTRANALREQGDLPRAEPLYEECLELCQKTDLRAISAAAQGALGFLARRAGDVDRAAELHAASLRLYNEICDQSHLSRPLLGLACVAADQGRFARCARLLGAEAALREARQTFTPPTELAERAVAEAAATSALGDDACAAERERGRSCRPRGGWMRWKMCRSRPTWRQPRAGAQARSRP